jgi:hypothetical protein
LTPENLEALFALYEDARKEAEYWESEQCGAELVIHVNGEQKKNENNE